VEAEVAAEQQRVDDLVRPNAQLFGYDAVTFKITKWQSVHVLGDGTAIVIFYAQARSRSDGTWESALEPGPIYTRLRRVNGRWLLEQEIEFGDGRGTG
jgi:hypothetical protein